jgi:hypothetical protein
MDILCLAVEKLKDTSSYLKEKSINTIAKVTDLAKKLPINLEKINDFYQNNKEIILVSSAVVATYLITRTPKIKKEEEKPKPKPLLFVKSKHFASD